MLAKRSHKDTIRPSTACSKKQKSLPLGDGVFEMREFFGPGWRMYYLEQSGAIVVMLGGGDKSSQVRDIDRAKQLAKELHDE